MRVFLSGEGIEGGMLGVMRAGLVEMKGDEEAATVTVVVGVAGAGVGDMAGVAKEDEDGFLELKRVLIEPDFLLDEVEEDELEELMERTDATNEAIHDTAALFCPFAPFPEDVASMISSVPAVILRAS